MTNNTGHNEIIARIQQREQEQSLVISISESLAPVSGRSEFSEVVTNQLKNALAFNHFTICIEDETSKNFRLYYHHIPSEYIKLKTAVFNDSSGIFEQVLNSAEPVLIPKSELVKTTGLPSFLKDTLQNFTHSVAAFSIITKRSKMVAFLGFGRDAVPERNILRIIKSLSSQLGITITNILLLENIIPSSQMIEEDIQAPSEIPGDLGIIGNSEAMQKVRSLIKLVSNTDSGVLILGESGTGKELVAKAIHENSERANKQLVKINCAAIPKNLLESELFGHEKGSFTGAIAQKKGKFEQAHKGTLFLDEVGEMPLELQVKLLRALQEKEIQRIGSNGHINVDTRIIAATNRNLQDEVNKGNFRADLYYRLNVFPIEVPALRERTDDIPDLANFFIQRYAIKNKKSLKSIAAKALNTIKVYHWPGNVRELEHAMERAFLLSPEKTIKEIQIGIAKEISKNAFIKPWNEFEKEYILSVLKFTKGKISGPNGAAALLEIPPTTLNSKMERLGIKKRHYLLK
ncbi:MAG: Fis family transcriptional regulator [Flavobacterium psychrophilum]|nr:MAG: Fis family transcriptional regulator [Flavobacterium psychrophilum]